MLVLFIAVDLKQLFLVLIPGENLSVASFEAHKQKVLVNFQICQRTIYHESFVDVVLALLETPDLDSIKKSFAYTEVQFFTNGD